MEAASRLRPLPSGVGPGQERFFQRKWSLWTIVLLALILRFSAAILWQAKAEEEGNLFRFGDSHSYWTLAECLAKGEPYQYGGSEARVFRAPGYPLFLAPFSTIQPPSRATLWARLAGGLLGGGCVMLVMWLSFRWGGLLARDAAGVIAAVYPGAIGMSIFLLSEAIFCPLVLAALALATHGQQAESTSETCSLPGRIAKVRRWNWFGCGFLSGLACLCRPSWILFPLFFFAMEGVLRRPIGATLKRCLLIGLGLSLAMSPWWYRNYLLTHRFVPTTLQVGATLYDGWHDGASGGSDEGMEFVSLFASKLRTQEANHPPAAASTFEYRLNRELQQAAVDWALGHPWSAVQLGWSKLVRTWGPLPRASQVEGTWLRLAEGGAYLFILTAAMAMLAFAPRSLFDQRLLWYPLAYYAILHTIFVGSVRYRQPPVLILAALAGVAVARVLAKRHPSTASVPSTIP